MRLIDADALIERLKISSPDPEGVDDWIAIINELPPITPQPQQKMGHWIKTPHGFKCSKCLIVHSHTSIFCPSCGAKMVEPHESVNKK